MSATDDTHDAMFRNGGFPYKLFSQLQYDIYAGYWRWSGCGCQICERCSLCRSASVRRLIAPGACVRSWPSTCCRAQPFRSVQNRVEADAHPHKSATVLLMIEIVAPHCQPISIYCSSLACSKTLYCKIILLVSLMHTYTMASMDILL